MKISVIQLFLIVRSLMWKAILATLLFVSAGSTALAQDLSAIAARYPELKVCSRAD